jgi:hypothetical protein
MPMHDPTLVTSSTGLLSTFRYAMSTRTSSICGCVFVLVSTTMATRSLCWQEATVRCAIPILESFDWASAGSESKDVQFLSVFGQYF